MIATENHWYDIVQYLLEKGANVYTRNKNGETAWSIALSMENNNIVDLLLSIRAEVREQDKFSLIDVAKNGHLI